MAEHTTPAVETNEAGTRTLEFRTTDLQVTAWITGPEHFTEMLVGVHTPREAWVATYDMGTSKRFDGYTLDAWQDLVRLVHLYR